MTPGRGRSVARNGERPRVAAFGTQYEVPYRGAFEDAEQSVDLIVRGECSGHLAVQQRVALTVERPFESRTLDFRFRSCGDERTVADGNPRGDLRHIDVVHQYGGHSLCARSGIDVFGELHEFFGRSDLDPIARRLGEEYRSQYRMLLHVVGHCDHVSIVESGREGDGDPLLFPVQDDFDPFGLGDADQCFRGMFAVEFIFDGCGNRRVDDGGVDCCREREIQYLLDGERDDLPVAERQRQVAVGVAGNILEQAAFAVVGFDRISFGVVQPFAVDGPESLGVDRYFGRVSAYGHLFAGFVEQRRSLAVSRYGPVI